MTKAEYLDFSARLIATIQHLLERPDMYLGNFTSAAAENFCMGINVALNACGVNLPQSLHRKPLQSRGWDITSTGGLDLMREQGLSDKQIAEELLHVQIARLELLAQHFTDAA